MNEHDFERFGEQLRQLGSGTIDLIYYPETGAFDLVPKNGVGGKRSPRDVSKKNRRK
jgi:hypothetical protein